MLVKGDKIKLVKAMGAFTNVGEICDVIGVTEDGAISFKFGGGKHMGCMSYDEFEKYFEKYEEPKEEEIVVPNTVTKERIEAIMNQAKVVVKTVFDKCTIVAVKLPNGFVIVESSACVDPENYSEDTGVEICMNRIIDKVWELEGYNLQEQNHLLKMMMDKVNNSGEQMVEVSQEEFMAAMKAAVMGGGYCVDCGVEKTEEGQCDCTKTDLDCVDEMYLLKIAEYHGGRVDDRAYTIRVTLNNVWDTKESIPTVVLRELYENDGISAYDFEGIFISDATLEAMKKIYIDKFDNSNGSKEFIEFYLEDLK